MDTIVDKAQASHQRVVECFLYGCLSVMVWDLLECFPDDVRLVKERSIDFPTVVYFTSRFSTLAFLIACSLDSSGNCIAFAVLSQCLLAVHRGSTSLLLYLRVHALYRSNESIRSFFVFIFTMIIAFSMIYWLPRDQESNNRAHAPSLGCVETLSGSPVLFWTSAMTSCAFEILIFVIITYKLGLYPELSTREQEHRFRWRFPLTRSSMHQIANRFFQDSLAYFLLAVLVKTPQIILLPLGGAKWQLLILFADAVLICVLSGKIFRDMKLGRPGVFANIPALRVEPSMSFRSAEELENLPTGSQRRICRSPSDQEIRCDAESDSRLTSEDDDILIESRTGSSSTPSSATWASSSHHSSSTRSAAML